MQNHVAGYMLLHYYFDRLLSQSELSSIIDHWHPTLYTTIKSVFFFSYLYAFIYQKVYMYSKDPLWDIFANILAKISKGTLFLVVCFQIAFAS